MVFVLVARFPLTIVQGWMAMHLRLFVPPPATTYHFVALKLLCCNVIFHTARPTHNIRQTGTERAMKDQTKKINQFLELGYTDIDQIRKILTENKNDVAKTKDRLATTQSSPSLRPLYNFLSNL
jgi:hypothetical protein